MEIEWSDNKEEKKQQILDCKRLLHFTMKLLYNDNYNGNKIKIKERRYLNVKKNKR